MSGASVPTAPLKRHESEASKVGAAFGLPTELSGLSRRRSRVRAPSLAPFLAILSYPYLQILISLRSRVARAPDFRMLCCLRPAQNSLARATVARRSS